MTEYLFRCARPFYFKIHAENREDAVIKARLALKENVLEDPFSYLKVELTAGLFDGRIYLEPHDILLINIYDEGPDETSIKEGLPF